MKRESSESSTSEPPSLPEPSHPNLPNTSPSLLSAASPPPLPDSSPPVLSDFLSPLLMPSLSAASPPPLPNSSPPVSSESLSPALLPSLQDSSPPTKSSSEMESAELSDQLKSGPSESTMATELKPDNLLTTECQPDQINDLSKSDFTSTAELDEELRKLDDEKNNPLPPVLNSPIATEDSLDHEVNLQQPVIDYTYHLSRDMTIVGIDLQKQSSQGTENSQQKPSIEEPTDEPDFIVERQTIATNVEVKKDRMSNPIIILENDSGVLPPSPSKKEISVVINKESERQLDNEISAIRLRADLRIQLNPKTENVDLQKTDEAVSYLKAESPSSSSHRHRRRSPVTVQEWVASLPPPHAYQSHDQDTKDENYVERVHPCPSFTSESRINQRDLVRPKPQKHNITWTVQDISQDGQGSRTNNSESEKTNDFSDAQQNQSRLGDDLMTDFPDQSSQSFRRLSASLDALEAAERDARDNSSSDEDAKDFEDDEDNDQIQLGEEAASGFDEKVSPTKKSSPNVDVNHHGPEVPSKSAFQAKVWRTGKKIENIGSNYNPRFSNSSFHPLDTRRQLLQRSHEQYASILSNISVKTVSSIESVFLSRAVDPAELLIDLGFGGGAPASAISRIPARFFATKSHAKGISVEEFLRKQEELTEKFDSGFNGYRGLNGSPSTRPSKLVEKIIEKIRSQDRAFRRQWSNLSSASLFISQVNRQRKNDPNKSRFEPIPDPLPSPNTVSRFASLVQHAWNIHHPGQAFPVPTPLSSPAGKFRAVANSVLSPANRQYMVEQAKRAAEAKNKRRIVIGGQAFSVDDDDLSVFQVDENYKDGGKKKDEVELEEEDVVPELANTDGNGIYRRLSGGQKRAPPLSVLCKQDSLASVTSSCSVESDWSDEEMEELERMFGDIQEKSTAADKCDQQIARWRQLRRSRKIAMQMHRGKTISRKTTSSSVTSMGTGSSVSDDAFLLDDLDEDEAKRWEATLIFSRLGSVSSDEQLEAKKSMQTNDLQ